MMAVCPSPPTTTTIKGHPEMYGLGIRLSFYLLWFAIIAFNWIPLHLRGGFIALRIMHLVFSFAVFIGLAGSISSSSSPLQAGEAYITLLLISSSVYLLVPLYMCRLITCCLNRCCCCCSSGYGCSWNCGWGATDYLLPVRRNNGGNRSKGQHRSSASWDVGLGGGILGVLELIFLLLVVGFQCWFWWSGVDDPSLGSINISNNHNNNNNDSNQCGGVPSSGGDGFLFGKIGLDEPPFKAFNSIVVLGVLIGALVYSAIDVGICCRRTNRKRKRRKSSRSHSHISLVFLRQIQTLLSLSVVVTLLVAIELSIQWNGISGDAVDQVSTAAQLIPLLITITLVLVAILHALTAGDDYEDGGSGVGYGSTWSGRSGGGGGSKGPSASSRGAGCGPVRDGAVVVDWSRGPKNGGGGVGGGGGGGGGFPGPYSSFPPPGVAAATPSRFPPQPILQPIPVFPRANTVLADPMGEVTTTTTTSSTSTFTTTAGSSPSSNSHMEGSSDGVSETEGSKHEEGRNSRNSNNNRSRDISGKGDHDEEEKEEKDHDHPQDHSSRVSGEETGDGVTVFGHPPTPIQMPFGRSMPTPRSGGDGSGGGGGERFPPPAWPPGWGYQNESTAPSSSGPMGFPPAPPIPVFIPGSGAVPPPPF